MDFLECSGDQPNLRIFIIHCVMAFKMLISPGDILLTTVLHIQVEQQLWEGLMAELSAGGLPGISWGAAVQDSAGCHPGSR